VSRVWNEADRRGQERKRDCRKYREWWQRKRCERRQEPDGY
jgi:hypothetical protein